MSVSKLIKRPPGRVGTVRSPKNVEALRQSFIRSRRRSARRHSVALGISDRSVGTILRRDLNFHQYIRDRGRGSRAYKFFSVSLEI
jgi:hypothetical protein